MVQDPSVGSGVGSGVGTCDGSAVGSGLGAGQGDPMSFPVRMSRWCRTVWFIAAISSGRWPQSSFEYR